MSYISVSCNARTGIASCVSSSSGSDSSISVSYGRLRSGGKLCRLYRINPEPMIYIETPKTRLKSAMLETSSWHTFSILLGIPGAIMVLVVSNCSTTCGETSVRQCRRDSRFNSLIRIPCCRLSLCIICHEASFLFNCHPLVLISVLCARSPNSVEYMGILPN